MKVKIFHHNNKRFVLWNVKNMQFAEINSLVVHLSGTYCKIRTAKETDKNSPFHHGPVQSYNNLENNPKQIRTLIGLKPCFYLTIRL